MPVKKVNLSDKEIDPFLHKLIYFDKRNRESASSTLYFCSYHFFNKVNLFKHLDELKNMTPKDVNSENFIDLIFDYKIDCLKIIAGIENYNSNGFHDKTGLYEHHRIGYGYFTSD